MSKLFTPMAIASKVILLHSLESHFSASHNMRLYKAVITISGTYDEEKIKQGFGTYIWMGPVSEDDDSLIELARFEGMYKDGQKTGYGKMIYPTGDIYQGEWFENKVCHVYSFSSSNARFLCLCMFI